MRMPKKFSTIQKRELNCEEMKPPCLTVKDTIDYFELCCQYIQSHDS